MLLLIVLVQTCGEELFAVLVVIGTGQERVEVLAFGDLAFLR